jgi:hypothetical protein
VVAGCLVELWEISEITLDQGIWALGDRMPGGRGDAVELVAACFHQAGIVVLVRVRGWTLPQHQETPPGADDGETEAVDLGCAYRLLPPLEPLDALEVEGLDAAADPPGEDADAVGLAVGGQGIRKPGADLMLGGVLGLIASPGKAGVRDDLAGLLIGVRAFIGVVWLFVKQWKDAVPSMEKR